MKQPTRKKLEQRVIQAGHEKNVALKRLLRSWDNPQWRATEEARMFRYEFWSEKYRAAKRALLEYDVEQERKKRGPFQPYIPKSFTEAMILQRMAFLPVVHRPSAVVLIGA